MQLVYQDWRTEWFPAMAQQMLELFHASHPNIRVFFTPDPEDLVERMPLETDRWYHVAGTYDGTYVKLYVDGDCKEDTYAPGITLGNSEPLYLSYNSASGFPYYLTGQMDEVRVWNYARSEQEIGSTMWQSLTGQEAGLVGYWSFEEAVDCQFVYDHSGSGSTGRLGSTVGVDVDDPARVPEPACLALLAAGATAALMRRRRS